MEVNAAAMVGHRLSPVNCGPGGLFRGIFAAQ